jgi:hypothetical protein
MAYSTGTSANIIVGAAALFINDTKLNVDSNPLPEFVEGESFKDTLTALEGEWRNVGYTTNGLELSFEPDFGEVMVDQLLDVAKLYKQGMKVNLTTTFAEATLENLLVSIAAAQEDFLDDEAGTKSLNIKSGNLGDYPIERSLIAVGASTEPEATSDKVERVYVANRVLSIQNVSVSSKRDAPTEFAVTFRLLPNADSSYGKIVDRTYTPETSA